MREELQEEYSPSISFSFFLCLSLLLTMITYQDRPKGPKETRQGSNSHQETSLWETFVEWSYIYIYIEREIEREREMERERDGEREMESDGERERWRGRERER